MNESTKELQVVARVRHELFDEQVWAAYRVAPNDFTRERSLTLPRVASLILRGHKVSQQNALNKCFRELNELEALTTASAYCQARQKLRPELFVRLNQVTHNIVASHKPTAVSGSGMGIACSAVTAPSSTCPTTRHCGKASAS